MTVWEYRMVSARDGDYLIAHLNEAGRSGWEAFHIEATTVHHPGDPGTETHYRAVMKRPVTLDTLGR